MRYLVIFIIICAVLHFSGAALQWSPSYTLKAVLTIPAANISEPYQVWNEGVSRNSRVDFYNGLVKLYKIFDDTQEKYRFFKIHPENTAQLDGKEMCSEVSADENTIKAEYKNVYLPIKDFKFIGIENIGKVEAHKYESRVLVKDENRIEAEHVYSVWVTFKRSDTQGSTPIPLKYTYQLITSENKVLDFIQHEYSYFEPSIPDPSMLQKPSGLTCDLIRLSSLHETMDPLVELVEPTYEHPRVVKAFERFKTNHNKRYTHKEEHFQRLNNFKVNLRSINSINRRKMSSVDVNHFADLSREEKYALLGKKMSEKDIKAQVKKRISFGAGNVNPPTFDWRDYDAITSVKDQTTQCNSCYAFVTGAAVESSAFINGGCKNMKEVSVQALIDCTWRVNSSFGNLGCQGGSNRDTLEWIEMHGAPVRDAYGRYLAMEGLCHFRNLTKSELLSIDGFYDFMGEEYVMKRALIKGGPLLTSIHSYLDSFVFYNGKVIYDDPECVAGSPTHGAVIVGYGVENGTGRQYWIMKNSWGPTWGENGYMRLAMAYNVCGVKDYLMGVFYKKNKARLCKPNRNN